KVDENGKQSENIVAKGTTLDGILERRITIPPKGKSHDKINDDAETVMKHYVEKNFLNPVDSERKFPNFMIAPNRGRGEKIKWESRYKNVAEEIEKISEETGHGWEITLDFKNNAYVVDVYESNDLSRTNEQGNDPVFFSPEFENIQSLELTRNDSEMKNYGYVAGQGEGEERKIIELGDESGWNRFETFIDARDVGGEDEDEEDMSENEIEEMLNERGKRKVRELKGVFSLEAEIIPTVSRTIYDEESGGPRHQIITPFQYEKDFFLGDIVEIVSKDWNVLLKTPIIEITEIHEENNVKIEAVFGEDRPTIYSKLDRRFKEVEDNDKNEVYYKYVDKKIDEVEKKNEKEEKALWTGTYYPMSDQEIKPKKKLSECLNGWELQWQAYNKGDGKSPNNF